MGPVRTWAVTGLLTLAAAFILLPRLGGPFALDQDTQRIFLAQRPLPDLLLHRGGDNRHPEGFYLVLKLLSVFGSGEAASRLPAALFGILCVAALHRWALARVPQAEAAGAAACLLLNPAFLAHSREVGPVTLFLLLVIVSTGAWERVLKRGGARDGVVYALSAGAMMHVYYFGALVLALHAGALALTWRRWERSRAGLAAWAGALLAALPACAMLVPVLREEGGLRALAASHPGLVWGDLPAGVFARGAGELLFPGPALTLLLAAAGFGAWKVARGGEGGGPRTADPARWLWLGWALAPALGLALLPWMRMKAYYFLWTLPAVSALVCAGAGSAGRSLMGRVNPARASLAAALLVGLAAGAGAGESWRRRAEFYAPDPRADLPRVVARIRAEGAGRVVVFDPHFLHSLFVYYSARNPGEALRSCRSGGLPFVECRYEDWRVLGLTLTAAFAPDWGGRSVDFMKRLASQGDFWYLEDPDFVNPEFHERMSRQCSKAAEFPKHTLYLCGRDR